MKCCKVAKGLLVKHLYDCNHLTAAQSFLMLNRSRNPLNRKLQKKIRLMIMQELPHQIDGFLQHRIIYIDVSLRRLERTMPRQMLQDLTCP